MDILKHFFYLCLLVAAAVQANPATTPSIEVSAKQLQIAAGEKASVTCTPQGNPLPRVQWRKHGGQFGAGTKISGNTLTIGDAQASDRGYYVCVGLLGTAVVAQKYVSVEVENADPPAQSNIKVTVSQRTLLIPKGGRGTVECTPEGHPLPTVRWIKSDGEFRDGISQSGNTLIISDAREEDRGHYVCQGIVEGTVMITDYMAVEIDNADRPAQSNIKVTVSQRTLLIPKGGRGTVECTPEGHPLPTVRWIKSDGEFRDGISQSGNTLIISDAREEDRGDYGCQGIVDGTVMITDYMAVEIDNADRPAQSNIKVTVSQRTLLIPKGGRGTVECTPEGHPLPTVRWIKSDGEFRDGISQSGNTLIISDAREEDRGHYVCQGIVEGTVMITDYMAVEIDNADRPAQSNIKVTVSQRTLLIPKGGRGTVECTPEGHPLPTVRWIKSDGEFRDGISQSGNTLIISDAREEDRGDYGCQGIVDGTVMITDYMAVEIDNADRPAQSNIKVTVSQRTLLIPKGGRGTVECTPEGHPLPTVRWIKSDGEFRDGISQSGNTLIISDAREEDRGHYVCQGIVDGTVMITDYTAVEIDNADLPAQSNIKVTVSQRTLLIPRGGRGTVECTPEGHPLPTVRWIKSDGEFRDGIRQSGKTLIISDAREEDRGHYVCQGIVDATVMITDYTAVEIDTNPVNTPSIEVSAKQLQIAAGENASVTCTPHGNPLPRVEWRKHGGQFGAGTKISGKTLTIGDAQASDRGYYVCVGLLGTAVVAQKYVSVEIENADPPAQSNIKVTVSQRTLLIPKGGRGTVECTPEGHPRPTVRWIKSDGEFRDGIRQSGNTLIISDAREEDRGRYVCQGIVDGTVMITDYMAVEIDNADPPAQSNIKVTVSQRTLLIPRGGRGTVECTPEGHPLPTVRWIKSDGEFRDGIRQSGNTLIISDAREEDRGRYVCQGIVDGTVMITDYTAVEIDNADPLAQSNIKVTVSQRTLLIPRGGRGTVECTPEGHPLPTVRWIKSDGEFRDGVRQSGNTLIISDAREEDRGHYVCQGIVDATVMITDYTAVEVDNADPSARSNLKVTVSQRTLLIPRGGRGTVECTPEGHPLPTVRWIKSDGEFRDGISQSGNTLIISDARVEDRGHYVCQGIVDGSVMLTNYTAVEIDTKMATGPVEKPKIEISIKRLKIPAGKSGSVTCKPGGNPLPSIQWRKHGGEFGARTSVTDNTLTIADAQEDDRGYYVCVGVLGNAVIAQNYVYVEIERAPQTLSPRPLKLIVSERQLRIPAGENGTIDCTPEGDPLPTVRWIKSDGEFRDGISQSGNTLIISDVREEDRGHYVCQGIVNGTVMLTNYSSVDIESNDRVPQTSSPRNLMVIVSVRQLRIPLGENGTIECTPEGDPLPTVQWIKSDGEFRDGVRQSGNTLIISDAREEDRGHYVCQGIVDGTVMLTNYSAVDIVINEGKPDQLPNPVDVVIPENTDFKVSCDFETGDLEQKVTWFRRDQDPLPQNAQEGQNLVIRSARKEDSGDYVCKVNASRGGFLLRILLLRLEVLALPLVSVRPPVQTVVRGEAVTVECVVDGDGAQVTWDRVDGSLSSRVEKQETKLYFSRIEVKDAGFYRCSAQNRAGITTGIAQVIVKDDERPHVVPGNPRVQVNLRQLTIPKGGNGAVECIPEGNPLPTVLWIKSDGEFRDGVTQSGNTLIISDAREEDRGHYVCQGIVDRTVMVTDYSAIDVKNDKRPPVVAGNPRVQVNVRQLTIPKGGSGTVQCIPDGNPLPTVLWIKSDGELRNGVTQSGNTLIISDAREEDRGHYVCQGIVDGTVMVTDYAAIDVENGERPPVVAGNVNVRVNVRQLTIPKGGNGAVKCIPDGNPLPTVLWIKSDGEFRDGVTQSGNTLIISDAREEDRGHYVCQGIVDGTVMVTDYSAIDIKNDGRPPVVAGNSRVQVNVRQLTIPRGGNGTVECIPEGNPLPFVQWSKYEGEFGFRTRQSGNALIISDAQEQDGGYYVCDGMVEGTAVWADYLTVKIESTESITPSVAYPRVTVSKRHVSIPRGGSTSIGCTAEGSPLPTVLWSKDEGDLGVGTRQSGNSLLISDAQEEDRGNYVCFAVVGDYAVFTDYLTVDIHYICEMPQEMGECRAAFDRWFYDSTQQKCQKFTWGGCGGNSNKFETEEQCRLECESMLVPAGAAA